MFLVLAGNTVPLGCLWSGTSSLPVGCLHGSPFNFRIDEVSFAKIGVVIGEALSDALHSAVGGNEVVFNLIAELLELCFTN